MRDSRIKHDYRRWLMRLNRRGLLLFRRHYEEVRLSHRISSWLIRSGLFSRGREMCATQQQQARDERPDDQGHRYRERTIHLLEVQPWQRQDVEILSHLP